MDVCDRLDVCDRCGAEVAEVIQVGTLTVCVDHVGWALRRYERIAALTRRETAS
jgi:hypothetical protein